MDGLRVVLRALEPEDLSFLYIVENDIANWEVSETKIPFSKYLLHEYLNNIGDDIVKTGQLRLIVEDVKSKESIGIVDLFDFDPINRRSGVGIVINKEIRLKGIGTEVLGILENYCRKTLNIHQLYCDIQANNILSIEFFEKNGFNKSGVKKDWLIKEDNYIDVLFYQKVIM